MSSPEDIEKKLDRRELSLNIRDAVRNALGTHPYWGIHCPQHYGSWLRNADGEIYYYPSKEIADAHIEVIAFDRQIEKHLWEAVEFGKQKYVDPYKVGETTQLCPTRTSRQS